MCTMHEFMQISKIQHSLYFSQLCKLLTCGRATVPFSHITDHDEFQQQRRWEANTNIASHFCNCPAIKGQHPGAAVIIISGAWKAARCHCSGTERPQSKEFIVVASPVGLDVRLEMNCSCERTQATYLWFNLFIAQEVWALSWQLTVASF